MLLHCMGTFKVNSRRTSPRSRTQQQEKHNAGTKSLLPHLERNKFICASYHINVSITSDFLFQPHSPQHLSRLRLCLPECINQSLTHLAPSQKPSSLNQQTIPLEPPLSISLSNPKLKNNMWIPPHNPCMKSMNHDLKIVEPEVEITSISISTCSLAASIRFQSKRLHRCDPGNPDSSQCTEKKDGRIHGTRRVRHVVLIR